MTCGIALYVAADPELVALRKRARRLTRAYNATTEEEAEQRVNLLREMFGAVGGRIEVEPPFRFTRHGFPPASTPAGMSRVTTLPAAIVVSSPIVTPGQTMTPPPSHTRCPIRTSGRSRRRHDHSTKGITALRAAG